MIESGHTTRYTARHWQTRTSNLHARPLASGGRAASTSDAIHGKPDGAVRTWRQIDRYLQRARCAPGDRRFTRSVDAYIDARPYLLPAPGYLVLGTTTHTQFYYPVPTTNLLDDALCVVERHTVCLCLSTKLSVCLSVCYLLPPTDYLLLSTYLLDDAPALCAQVGRQVLRSTAADHLAPEAV